MINTLLYYVVRDAILSISQLLFKSKVQVDGRRGINYRMMDGYIYMDIIKSTVIVYIIHISYIHKPVFTITPQLNQLMAHFSLLCRKPFIIDKLCLFCPC